MTQHIEKLPHAPLQEVIFELHWKLDIERETGLFYDKEFPIAAGRFFQLAQSIFPTYVSLKPPTVPDHLFSFKAVHQYWTEEKIYPVMQLGPGLFTVNDTDRNYIWKDFKNHIFTGVEWLQRSYRNQLNPDFIELRYIDAIEITDEEYSELPEYLEKNLKIVIKNNIELPKNQLFGLQLVQRFKLEDENYLTLTFNNGIRNIDEVKVIILHTSVSRSGIIDFNGLEKWIEYAHSICSDLFKKTVSKELYDRFSKAN